MRVGKGAAGRRGFTLVEIMIVIAILGILSVLAVSTFQGLNEKYRVEAETKQLYADLMDARGRAMQRNRAAFFRVDPGKTSYQTYEDTSPAPDGNGVLDNTADTRIAGIKVDHKIHGVLSVVPSIDFNRNGIASASDNVWLESTAQPDYDCITIRPTRIKMGKWNGATCDEK